MCIKYLTHDGTIYPIVKTFNFYVTLQMVRLPTKSKKTKCLQENGCKWLYVLSRCLKKVINLYSIQNQLKILLYKACDLKFWRKPLVSLCLSCKKAPKKQKQKNKFCSAKRMQCKPGIKTEKHTWIFQNSVAMTNAPIFLAKNPSF